MYQNYKIQIWIVRVLILLYFLLGVISIIGITTLSILIRIELFNTGNNILLNDFQVYNSIVTIRCLLIVLFIIMLIVISGIGNFIFPNLFGALNIRSCTNNISFWLLPIIKNISLSIINIFIIGILKLSKDFVIDYNINYYITLYSFNLYLILFIISLYYVTKSFKFITSSFNYVYKSLLICFGIIFIYGFYTKLTIITFILSIGLILIFSQFITCLRLLALENKILLILANKNYTKWIERIILIKILLFYCYLYDNTMFFCDSFWTRLAHDTFMELGTKLGAKPQTTVSFLETTGMIALIGLFGFGSIKLYQYSIGYTKPSIETRLANIEQKLANINMYAEQNINHIGQIINHQVNTVQFIGDQFKMCAALMGEIEKHIVNIGNSQNLILVGMNTSTKSFLEFRDNFYKNQTAFNAQLQTNLSENLKVLNSKLEEFAKKINSSEIDSKTIHELSTLRFDLENLLKEQNTIITSIPTNESDVINTITTTESAIVPQSITEGFHQVMRKANVPLPIYTRSASGSNLNRYMSNLDARINTINSKPSVPSIPRIPNTNITADFNKFNYEMIETSEGFILKRINRFANTTLEPTMLGTVVSRVTNISGDLLIRTVSSALGNVITGSLTLAGLQSILNAIGLGNTPTSTSQRVGENTVSVIRDFIRGLANEIRKK